MNMKLFATTLAILTLIACQSVVADNATDLKKKAKTNVINLFNPASDPSNQYGWQLNTHISDEFNDNQLDESKWYIQGQNQEFYLWKGRAPSQFSPHNVRLEEGKLKLRTQWEPDYAFVGTPPKKQEKEGYTYENITTAAVIGHNTFLYGYMEVRVKIPDAAMTGAFWGTGFHQELDIFELVGEVKIGNKNPETTYVTSIHDWRPNHPPKNKVWKHAHKMKGRTADAFHVYGVQWMKDGLKMYLDGELVHEVNQSDMGDNWVLNNPMELWFDSEVFPWHGVPSKEDLPVDYEIDYLRVWQQPQTNLLDPAFFGFEGPFITKKVSKPQNRGVAQKFWYMDDKAAKSLSITQDKDFKFSTGRKSLKFAAEEKNQEKKLVTFSPYGSVKIPQGKFSLSMKIWLEPNSKVRSIYTILDSPWLSLKPIDLIDLEHGRWITVSQEFSRSEGSTDKDRLRLTIYSDDVKGEQAALYIDDISISSLQD